MNYLQIIHWYKPLNKYSNESSKITTQANHLKQLFEGGAIMFWINNKEQLERLERRYKNAQIKLIAVSDTRALVKITY